MKRWQGQIPLTDKGVFVGSIDASRKKNNTLILASRNALWRNSRGISRSMQRAVVVTEPRFKNPFLSRTEHRLDGDVTFGVLEFRGEEESFLTSFAGSMTFRRDKVGWLLELSNLLWRNYACEHRTKRLFNVVHETQGAFETSSPNDGFCFRITAISSTVLYQFSIDVFKFNREILFLFDYLLWLTVTPNQGTQ